MKMAGMIAGMQGRGLSGCAELLWLSGHEVVNALTPSLASQLPQGSMVYPPILASHKKMWDE
jgi:hypothetical protein